MSLLFGRLTQDFVGFGTILNEIEAGEQGLQQEFQAAAAAFRHSASTNALYLVIIGMSLSVITMRYSLTNLTQGIGMLVATFIYMYTWVYTGEVNAKRLREKYLQAVLRQDIAYFDNVGAGEVATRIQTDTRKLPCPLRLVLTVLNFPCQISSNKVLLRRWRFVSTSLRRSLLVSSLPTRNRGVLPWPSPPFYRVSELREVS